MKLLLFLGSGVSAASGLPRVHEITHSLLNGQWYRGTNSKYSLHPPQPSFFDSTALVQRFLKLLKSYADGYYSLRGGQEATYEDLYYLSQQLFDDERGQIDNPAVLGFLTEVKARTEELVTRMPSQSLVGGFGEIVNQARNLIGCVIENMVATPKKIEGMNLIAELASSEEISLLDIVTLNHDLLVETFLANQSVTLIDGFTTASRDVRHFEPCLFEEIGKVRLFKLHGSINWYRFRKGNEDFVGIPINGDPDHCRDDANDDRYLENLSGGSIFLAGTYNKILRYGVGIFSEMHFWLHRLLKEHNTMAMSGYGWKDFGVNARLLEWLLSDGTKRLFLMHERPLKLAATNRQLTDYYGELVGTRRIIPIKKWMKDVTASELLRTML